MPVAEARPSQAVQLQDGFGPWLLSSSSASLRCVFLRTFEPKPGHYPRTRRSCGRPRALCSCPGPTMYDMAAQPKTEQFQPGALRPRITSLFYLSGSGPTPTACWNTPLWATFIPRLIPCLMKTFTTSAKTTRVNPAATSTTQSCQSKGTNPKALAIRARTWPSGLTPAS